MAQSSTAPLSEAARTLEADGPLRQLGAEALVVEPGYVELAAPLEPAAAHGPNGAEAAISAGALAVLAEGAARLAAGARPADTAEISLHLHDLSGAPGAERLLARGELLRPARSDRPIATAQADVFRVGPGGAEALLATALISLVAAA